MNSNKTIKKKSHRYMSCGILCLCEFIIVLGQLNAYVGYYKKNEMIEGDNPPVGILLCTDKGSQMVEYALSGMDNQLFVSTYMLHLQSSVFKYTVFKQLFILSRFVFSCFQTFDTF